MLGLSQAGFAREGVQILPCLPTEFCGRDASRRAWTGWIDAPAPFFLWNRRPRNRSFQPAHPFSPFRHLEPMARPVQKFQYAGFGTRCTMACWFVSNHLSYRHLVEAVA